MARKNTPSSVMYRQLKSLGISNHEAARTLLNTSLVFDGKTLAPRIEDSSQLTRRIVHVEPGEIPVGMFNSFNITCPQLHKRALARVAAHQRCSEEDAARWLAQELRGPASQQMLEALTSCGVDGAMFRNMLAYLDHMGFNQPQDRSLVLLMLLVVTGCTGNPRTAALIVVNFATEVLGADYHTIQTVFHAPQPGAGTSEHTTLGLVRTVDGCIVKGTPMHVLSPTGTTIGLMPQARHTVIDVGDDVSREHARAWREDGRWLVRDLGSTNGTRVIRHEGGEMVEALDEPVELFVFDTLCLGSSTSFLVLPIMDPEGA